MKPLLSPREVATAIGVSESTLKRWTDDGLINAIRTAGGHRRIPVNEAIRFVRDTQARIVNPTILGLADVAGLEDLPLVGTAQRVEQVYTALLDGDVRRVRGLATSLFLDGMAMTELCDDIVTPAMQRIGELWQEGDDGIFIEHRATDLSLQALHHLQGMIEVPEDAPVAVGGGPSKDPYLLGTLMAATCLADAGIRAINLGADTPVDSLARAAERCGASLVWLSISAPCGVALTESLVALVAALEQRDACLVVGGRSVDRSAFLQRSNVHVGRNMRELVAFARGVLVGRHPRDSRVRQRAGPARRGDEPMKRRHVPSVALLAVAAVAAAAGPAAVTAPAPAPAPAPDPAPPSADVLENSIGMKLRRVPAGTFRMGSEPGETGHRVNESPAHEVRIERDFLIGETEVTVGQFQRFVDETGYVTDAERDAEGGFGLDWTTGRVVQARGIDFRDPGFPGFVPGDEHPAILLSWRDAEAFCRWLGRRENRRYRLPTEAEWERAARGGTRTPWWHGTDPAGRANVADASLAAVVPALPRTDPWDDGHAFLAPVGRYPANPYGLFDMHGNVWEWCADEHDDTAYARRAGPEPHVDRVPPAPAAGPEGEPAIVDAGFRVIRGGGWLNPSEQSRAAQRVYFTPTFRYCLLSGFRVVLETDD